MWRALILVSTSQHWQILRRCNSSFFRPFSSSSSETFESPLKRFWQEDTLELTHGELIEIGKAISAELRINSGKQSLSILQRLDISFGHVPPSKALICSTLKYSERSGVVNFSFLKWLTSKSGFTLDDESLSFFVYYFGRKSLYKSIHELLCHYKGVVGIKCFQIFIKRLVQGHKNKLLRKVFDRMEQDYGFVRDRKAYRHIIWRLSDNARGDEAVRLVKDLTNEFFPDDNICDLLIVGLCRMYKLEKARRLLGEMYRGGFRISVIGYNAILDCVCKICRIRNPFKMEFYAEKVLMDMDTAGVPRNVATFNVMIKALCVKRKTEDAMQWFHKMGEFGVAPNGKTFYYLTWSLYKAGMIGEGDRMLEKLRQPGFEKFLDYELFINKLLSINLYGHALKVFRMMKKDGRKVPLRLYRRLMRKLVACNRISTANSVFDEGVRDGVPGLVPEKFPLDPKLIARQSRNTKPLRVLRPLMNYRKLRKINSLIKLSKYVQPQKQRRKMLNFQISRMAKSVPDPKVRKMMMDPLRRRVLDQSVLKGSFWQWRQKTVRRGYTWAS